MASAPPRAYAADVLLRDGTSIRLREASAADAPSLETLLAALTEREVAENFARAGAAPSAHVFTLLGELRTAEGVRLVGAACYALHASPHESPRAELLLAVPARDRGRGIGTLLLEHLVSVARARGVAEFRADVLGETNRMLEVLATSGLVVRRSDRAGSLRVAFATAESEELAEAVLAREKTAAAESLRPILWPKSVAVVGASREPNTIGHQIVKNLIESGYTGRVVPVNPKAQEIEELPCFPSVAAARHPVDLAVIAVPARFVEAVLDDCVTAGVRGAVVISAGFAEISDNGR